jgi:hypothetical protein
MAQLPLTDDFVVIVIRPNYTRVQLRLDNCTRYAIGQDPSGRSIIWAAGKAGWFEILPSTHYAAVYDDIVKAIDLIYFLSDAHQEFSSRRPVRGARVHELLALYQQHTDFHVDEDAEVEALLEKHHSFLIRQMLGGWEGISWRRTYLWAYFSRLYLNEVMQESNPKSDNEFEQEDSASSAERISAAERLAYGSRPKQYDWTDAIFAEILNLRASGHLDRRRCSVDGIAETLFRQYNVTSMCGASDIVQNAALALLPRLDADLTLSGHDFWSKRTIYRQLQKLADTQPVRSNLPVPIKIETPTEIHPNYRHRKSILRPSTGAGKGRKRMAEAQSSPSDEDLEVEGDLENPREGFMDPETPTKKRLIGYLDNGESRAVLLNTDAMLSALANGSASGLRQRQQLELIRQEGMANGRRRINHLEALVGGLVQERHE